MWPRVLLFIVFIFIIFWSIIPRMFGHNQEKKREDYDRLLTVRKSLHRSCWTELTCQGNLLPLDRVTDSRRESSREQGSTHKRKQDLSSMDSFIPSYRFTRTKEMKIAGIKISSQPCQPIIWWSALREVQISLPKSSVSTRWMSLVKGLETETAREWKWNREVGNLVLIYLVSLVSSSSGVHFPHAWSGLHLAFH